MYISLYICIYTIQEPRIVLIWNTYIYKCIYIVCSYIHYIYWHINIYTYQYMYISLCICIYTIQEPRDVLMWSTYISIYIYIVRSYIHSLYSHTYHHEIMRIVESSYGRVDIRMDAACNETTPASTKLHQHMSACTCIYIC